MGFNVADIITGEDLVGDAPLVAILLGMDGGSNRRRTHTAIRPATLFPIESLPIRGTYYDWGEFNVDDEAQLAVAMTLKMTECSRWAEFRDKNSDGFDLAGKTDVQFGYAVMHATTYDSLLALGSAGRMRTAEEVAVAREKVKSDWTAFLGQCRTVLEDLRSRDSLDPMVQARNFIIEHSFSRALALSDWGDVEHVRLPEGLTRPEVPEFMRIQGSGAEFSLEGPFLKKVLAARGYTGEDFLSRLAEQGDSRLPELLEQVSLRWELNEVQSAMAALGKAFTPAIFRGEGGNAAAMLAWQTEMLKQTFAREKTCLDEGYMVASYYPELCAQGKKIETLGLHVQAVAVKSAPAKHD